jgi:hypothetical protein
VALKMPSRKTGLHQRYTLLRVQAFVFRATS